MNDPLAGTDAEYPLKRRQVVWRVAALAVAVSTALICVQGADAAAVPTLEYRNMVSLNSTVFSDLSGLTWLGGNDWRAISDKANAAPKLTISINPATGKVTSVSAASADTLGTPLNDYEGIAYDAVRQSYFVSEEATPAVHEYSATTLTQVGSYAAPTGFAGNTRSNRGLESLSLNAAGTRLYTANEEALTIDGPSATPTNGTDVRIVEYSITGNTAGAGVSELHQYVYQVEPIPQADGSGTTHHGQSGLSDIAVLPDGRLLMLERSVYYTKGWPVDSANFVSRIYLVDLAAATPLADPTKAVTDSPNSATPIAKTLLYQGTDFNMEGLAVGPATDQGISILGITDNQKASTYGLIGNQVTAFELIVPEPNSGMLLIPAGLLLLMRRREAIRR